MVNEIIKLIEYITGNPIFQGAFIVYAVFGAIVTALVIAVFVIVFREIIKRMR